MAYNGCATQEHVDRQAHLHGHRDETRPRCHVATIFELFATREVSGGTHASFHPRECPGENAAPSRISDRENAAGNLLIENGLFSEWPAMFPENAVQFVRGITPHLVTHVPQWRRRSGGAGSGGARYRACPTFKADEYPPCSSPTGTERRRVRACCEFTASCLFRDLPTWSVFGRSRGVIPAQRRNSIPKIQWYRVTVATRRQVCCMFAMFNAPGLSRVCWRVIVTHTGSGKVFVKRRGACCRVVLVRTVCVYATA